MKKPIHYVQPVASGIITMFMLKKKNMDKLHKIIYYARKNIKISLTTQFTLHIQWQYNIIYAHICSVFTIQNPVIPFLEITKLYV